MPRPKGREEKGREEVLPDRDCKAAVFLVARERHGITGGEGTRGTNIIRRRGRSATASGCGRSTRNSFQHRAESRALKSVPATRMLVVEFLAGLEPENSGEWRS